MKPNSQRYEERVQHKTNKRRGSMLDKSLKNSKLINGDQEKPRIAKAEEWYSTTKRAPAKTLKQDSEGRTESSQTRREALTRYMQTNEAITQEVRRRVQARREKRRQQILTNTTGVNEGRRAELTSEASLPPKPINPNTQNPRGLSEVMKY